MGGSVAGKATYNHVVVARVGNDLGSCCLHRAGLACASSGKLPSREEMGTVKRGVVAHHCDGRSFTSMDLNADKQNRMVPVFSFESRSGKLLVSGSCAWRFRDAAATVAPVVMRTPVVVQLARKSR
jgi:hypothetical protein